MCQEDVTLKNYSLDLHDRQLKTLFESAIDAIVITDDSGRHLDVNPAACQLFGASREELLSQEINAFCEAGFQFSQIWQGIEQEARLTGEFRLLRPDGTTCEVEYVTTVNFLPHRHLSVIRNITHRKQMEQNLERLHIELKQQTAERYHSVVHHNEASLAKAQQVAHIGSWEFDAGTGKITWSEELFRIFGLAPSQPEPTFEQHLQQIHPDDRAHWQATVEAALRAGTPYLIEFKICRPDGTIRTLEARGEAERDAHGRVTRLFGTSQDITDRKVLEDRLRSQLHKEQALNHVIQTIHQSLDLSVIFSNAAEAIGEFSQVDRVKIVQYYSHQKLWRIVAEYRRTRELSSTLGNEIWDEGNQATAQLKHFQVVHTDGSLWTNFELGQQADSGVRVAIPLQIRGEVWGALSLMKNQAALPWEESETEFLSIVATQLAIAIQQSELHQQVQALNTHLEKQVEVRTAELQSALYRETVLKRITDMMRNSLDEAAILQTVVSQLGTALQVICCDAVLYNEDHTNLTIRYDYTQGYPSAQGKTVDLSLHQAEFNPLLQEQLSQFCLLRPIPDSPYPELYHSTVIICPIRDAEDMLGELWLFASPDRVFNLMDIRLVEQVADQCGIALRQSRLYQASQAYAKELEGLNQLKDDFLSTVTHELRAPMANIKMAAQMLELLLNPLNVLDAKTIQYFEILKQECDREINLINDLLDLSRLETGKVQLNLATMDLQGWLAQIIEPFVERSHSQGQELFINLATDLPPFETDPSYLQRIVTELIHNACKYTPAGERIVVAAQWLDTGADNQDDQPSSRPYLQIRITNTGIEIPEHERDRVFDKFYRIPNNDPWKHGGTGLGLALIKKLTERLGGTISLESSGGETTFTLRFFKRQT